MPGLKIIEVVLGLVFVYLLLSLLCTAINEYISGMLNKRGRELFKAVDALLGSEEVQEAFYGHPLITTLSPHHAEIRRRAKEIEEKLYGTRWARRLMGWLRPAIRAHRYPSYLPARNFALALLNSTDYTAVMQGMGGAAGSPPAGDEVVETPGHLVRLFDALMQESAADVSELLRDPAVATILGSPAVPQAVRDTVTGVATGTERQVQKLQDSVEVWFNNAMDRVSGAYKRYTQVALLLIGLVVAILLNADTLKIWQALSTDDELREAVVRQAVAFDAAYAAPVDSMRAAGSVTADTAAADTTAADTLATGTAAAPAPASAPADTAASDSSDCEIPTGAAATAAFEKALAGRKLTCGEARVVLAMARAELDSSQLAVGWTDAELLGLGVARVDTVPPDTAKQAAATGSGTTAVQTRLAPVLRPWKWHRSIWPKLLGLILTAIAVSLGAPFWFDMLNKIVNIRSAGRAPDERAKSPEASGKRLAEVSPK
jgi:hypothetical protein